MYPLFKARKAIDPLAFPTPSAIYVYRVDCETLRISFATSSALFSLIVCHPQRGNAGHGRCATETFDDSSL